MEMAVRSIIKCHIQDIFTVHLYFNLRDLSHLRYFCNKMAFVRSIATAQSLNKYKKDLIKEKQSSIEYRTTGKRKFKFRWIGVKIRAKLRRFKRRIGYCCCCKKFCFNLKHYGSVENYVLKSLLGFLGGLILTYIFFMVCVFQLNLRISTSTIICSVMGCILVNGLAFSTKIRCIVLLTLPHFFGEKGRQLLVAYALILVIAGPAQNILNNLGILSESLACGQEQLKSVLRQIFEVIKKPFYAIKDAIKKVVATVKKVIKKIKEILIKIKRIIMAIVRVIKAAFMFLAKIINICNKELGTPFERCARVFDNAIADCNAKLGPIFSWMCSIAYIVKTVCYIVKIFDVVCMVVDFISNSIIGVVIRKVKTFVRHIRTMFYVRIKFSHSYHFESTASKTVAEISKEIVGEIKDRIRTIAAVFQFIFSAASLFVIIMVAKVLIYRYRFLTKDGFDNKYLTEDFFQLDMRRAKHNRETILPLNQKEEKLYVKIKSTKLTDVESKKLRKAVMNLLTICLKTVIYMAVDYALFWILNMIKYYGRYQSKVQAPNIPVPHISGSGLLADLLSSIVKAFQPMGLTLEIDTVPCLPTPLPPDYDKYIQIATFLILCWVLTLLEPYGLRFRSYIMTYYHPTRGKQRAIWLYNKILRKRSSFLKFARRQLRKKITGSKEIEKVTLKEFLSAHFRLFALCFDKNQEACLLCGKVFRESDSEKPIRCATPGCAGIYCDQCFADLRNLCTVCLSPIEYGDFSDLSEEKDSSEEDISKIVKKKSRKKKLRHRLFSCCKKKSIETLSDEEIPLVLTPRVSKKSLEEKKSSEVSLLKQENGIEEDEKEEQKEVVDIIKEEEDEDSSVEEETDSGNASATSITSDYSYRYQYSKETQNPEPLEVSSRDVEKQEILDYASMDNFKDDTIEEFEKENYEETESDEETEIMENKSLIQEKKSPLTSKQIISVKAVSSEKIKSTPSSTKTKKADSDFGPVVSDQEGFDEEVELKEMESFLRKDRSQQTSKESFEEKISAVPQTDKEVVADFGSVTSESNDLDIEKRQENLLRNTKSSQIPNQEKVSKQTSTEIIIQRSKKTMKPEISKADVGTMFSDEIFKNTKQDQHIDFIGVYEKDQNKPKRKMKKKRKHKAKTVICACSDSEEGIEYWESTPMVGVLKSTTFTNTRENKPVKCKCKKTICICKLRNSHEQEENTTDSMSYSSSTELRSLIEPKAGPSNEGKERKEERIKDEQKRSKLKMFIKRIIPKYKIQREK